MSKRKEAIICSYYVSFSSSASEKLVSYVRERLQDNGLQCKLARQAGCWSALVEATIHVLTKQAEQDKWMMKVRHSEELMEFREADVEMFALSSRGTVFESCEEIRLLHDAIETTQYQPEVLKSLGYRVEAGKGLLSALMTCEPGVLEDHFPLHDNAAIRELDAMLKKSSLPLRGVDVTALRNYFGERVAFYFAWMDYYSACILVPAVVGVVMYLVRGRHTTVDTDPYLPFYSVFMALWAVLYLVFWQRRGASFSFQWNTHSHSAHKILHHKYHGTVTSDPVTGGTMLFYPRWKQRLWYVFSFLAMLPLLLVGVAFMTFSLNLNGYVRNTESPIYVQWLAQFAQPGEIFASDSRYYLWLVPTLMHSVVINIINQLYSQVARKCTDLENHRTMDGWLSALVVKRVFFECFDCFMPLFYIAFYQLDVVTLRSEIVSLFMSDEIRRVLMEAVIPLVTGVCMRKRAGSRQSARLDRGESFLSEYDQFDDYLEMVIQFGYITLFASAFPLGGVVTMLFIYVELRSDVFKLLHAYRRPVPFKCRGIGVWFGVMQSMVFLAILTNCAILGFSSEQLIQWLPYLFTEDSGGDSHVMAMGSGRYVVGVVFGFEHILLVVAVLLQHLVHPVPKWVRIAIARREYLAKKRAAIGSAGSTTALKKEKTS